MSNPWAKSFRHRIGSVKWSSTAKMTVANFEEICEQFLIDIKAIIDLDEIPPDLVFNCYETGVSIVPDIS